MDQKKLLNSENLNYTSINPSPIVYENHDFIVNDYLSPSKLQEISCSNDLSKVTQIEMVVDTSETSLGNFGQYLPQLIQLKLNNSLIPTLRDIGTSLQNLQILWLSRCKLNDLDGISSILNLKELYISFNNVSDLSSICFLESLEVLDLEANLISDIEQIDYLSMLNQLSILTLTGNQITNLPKDSYNGNTYREYIITKLPQLEILDDLSVKYSEDNNLKNLQNLSNIEDINIITNAIKNGISIDDYEFDLPDEDSFLRDYLQTDELVQNTPNSKNDSNKSVVQSDDQDHSSSLTFGLPHCGSPINLLRNRRKILSNPIVNRLIEDNSVEQNKKSLRPMTALGISTNNFYSLPGDDDFDFKIEKTKSIVEEDKVNEAKMKEFDASKPPDFLHHLKPTIKQNKPQMSKTNNSKLKSLHQLDKEKLMRKSLLPNLYQLPNPPLRRPTTTSPHLRSWQQKRRSLETKLLSSSVTSPLSSASDNFFSSNEASCSSTK